MRSTIALCAMFTLGFPISATGADFSLDMCPETIAPRAIDGRPPYPQLEFTRRDRQKVQFPLVGKVETAEIGQSMISHLNYSILPGAITLKTDVKFEGLPPATNRRGFLIFGKTKHKFIVTVPSGRYSLRPSLTSYLPLPVYSTNAVPLRQRDNAPYNDMTVGLFPTLNGVEILWGKQDAFWSSGPIKADFDIEYCAHWQEGDFRRELVYSGISQNTVTIYYREYISDLSRPAFTQELKYDLNSGNEVGFRGARFEILSATNTLITYKVVTPLD